MIGLMVMIGSIVGGRLRKVGRIAGRLVGTAPAIPSTPAATATATPASAAFLLLAVALTTPTAGSAPRLGIRFAVMGVRVALAEAVALRAPRVDRRRVMIVVIIVERLSPLVATAIAPLLAAFAAAPATPPPAAPAAVATLVPVPVPATRLRTARHDVLVLALGLVRLALDGIAGE
ncbi:MAG: hypothetical protein J0H65_10200, partial [Rhizobiales bacterium]|nr:hypothetical protein [Hyphomicrobiales bacterium]